MISMRPFCLLALAALLSACAPTSLRGQGRLPSGECDPHRSAGVPCVGAPVTTDTRLQTQADSVLALPPAAVTTEGLVLVQRAHADRLNYVEARAVTGDRKATGVIVYLVGAAAVGALLISLLDTGS